jgi:hypothetical protein
MSQQVLCIAGLPGSGKTCYAKTFQDRLLVDDPKDLSVISEALATGKDLVITDPHFCLSGIRILVEEYFRKVGSSVSWVFFENDPEACKENLTVRNDGRLVTNTLQLYAKKYQIPPNSVILPVWRKKVLPQKIG